MDYTAELFDLPPDSSEHAELRDTAWTGGHYVEGRYLLGMLVGKNLFRVSHEDYLDELHTFISTEVSDRAATVFATATNADFLMPFLRRLYGRDAGFPALNMPRNDRVERGIEFLLNNLDASDADLAAFLRTTEKQVKRLSGITAARRAIRLHHESVIA